jgi:hypothetical protein
VRIKDVSLGNGAVLRFEVRFGAAASTQRMPDGATRTGIVQVNIDSGNTRVVEKVETQPPPDAAPSTALPSDRKDRGSCRYGDGCRREGCHYTHPDGREQGEGGGGGAEGGGGGGGNGMAASAAVAPTPSTPSTQSTPASGGSLAATIIREGVVEEETEADPIQGIEVGWCPQWLRLYPDRIVLVWGSSAISRCILSHCGYFVHPREGAVCPGFDCTPVGVD